MSNGLLVVRKGTSSCMKVNKVMCLEQYNRGNIAHLPCDQWSPHSTRSHKNRVFWCLRQVRIFGFGSGLFCCAESKKVRRKVRCPISDLSKFESRGNRLETERRPINDRWCGIFSFFFNGDDCSLLVGEGPQRLSRGVPEVCGALWHLVQQAVITARTGC